MDTKNLQIDTDIMTPVSDLRFERLDTTYETAHLITVALGYAFLMGIALLLLLIGNPWFCIIAECVIFVALIINLMIIPKCYLFKGYALREDDLTYRSGLFLPSITTIPFSRMQQVSLKQNPVLKMLGLYSVEVVNGAQTVASLTIPGLREASATRIKDIITDKINARHD